MASVGREIIGIARHDPRREKSGPRSGQRREKVARCKREKATINFENVSTQLDKLMARFIARGAAPAGDERGNTDAANYKDHASKRGPSLARDAIRIFVRLAGGRRATKGCERFQHLAKRGLIISAVCIIRRRLQAPSFREQKAWKLRAMTLDRCRLRSYRFLI